MSLTLRRRKKMQSVVVFQVSKPLMTKRGVAGPWVSVDQPPPPTSLPRAGQCPYSRNLQGRRQREGRSAGPICWMVGSLR